MKYLSFLPLSFMLCIIVQAQQKDVELVVPSKISNVTVYLAGAEIQREADVSLSAGRSRIKLEGLSAEINTSSITAGINNEVKIISITHQINYLRNMKQNGRIKTLRDSLEIIGIEIEKIRYERSALMEEQKLVTENRTRIGQKEGVTTTELAAATTFYRNKLNEINGKLLNLGLSEKKLKVMNDGLNNQLYQINSLETRPSSEIIITVDSKNAVKSKIDLRYLISSAGWAPKYDLRTKGAGSPIQLDYRAQVFNNTKEEWENVRLVLSTGDPSKNMSKPVMQTWGLHYFSDNSYNQSYGEGRLNTITFKGDELRDSVKSRSTTVSYSTIDVSELSVEFNIKNPYSIPSDSKPYLVDINEYKLENVTYDYFAIPKVDKDAFLIGKITNWESLNLIEGDANIYFNDTYIGKTHLQTHTANDTLELSLGRDRKINIARLKKQDFNSKKFIGLNRSESFAYEIDVRNNNSVPVKIELWDQVPVAQESDIEVHISEISGAIQDPVSGKLLWNLSLAPSESRKLVISFTVKYPKSKNLFLRPMRKLPCPTF
jgi:uncharacterized protein (TIGR02231 family)